MTLNPIFIKATDFSDAWFQTLYACVEHGREFIIDQGSFAGQKRLEFDHITIQITHPGTLPLLPKLNPLLNIPDPVAEGYLDEYLPYLMTGEIQDREAYSYGQRICAPDVGAIFDLMNEKQEHNIIPEMGDDTIEQFNAKDILFSDKDAARMFLNQMELMIWTYKNKGHRNNQMILQVGQPSDMLLKDPPCLRHIDTRIQDGKLHFFPYFRSWDLWGGFPANLAAIELMKQYCAAEIGVENGEIIASSKGLHLYNYVWEITEAIRGKKILDSRKDLDI